MSYSAEKKKFKAHNYIFNKRHTFQRFNNVTFSYTYREHTDARITDGKSSLKLPSDRTYLHACRTKDRGVVAREHRGGSKGSRRAWEWRFKGSTRGCGWLRGSWWRRPQRCCIRRQRDAPCAYSNRTLMYIRPFYAFTLFGLDSNLILWITRPVWGPCIMGS